MKKNRDQNVDIYRGIAIMLILAGHLFWTDSLASLIYSFHLPLFFFVTGFFIESSSKKYTFKQYVISRSKNIMFPYLLALVCFLFLTISVKLADQGIASSFYELINIIVISSSNVMEVAKYQLYYWFMPFFFLYTVFLYVIFKYLKKYLLWVYILSIVLAFIIFDIHINTNYVSDAIPWSVDKLPFVIPLGILGHAIWQKKKSLLNKRNLKLTICTLVLLLGSFYKTDLRIMFISNIFVYFILAINGSIFTILLSDFLDKNLSDGPYSLKRLIIFIGENSMLVYLLHGIVYPMWHGRMGSPAGYSTMFNLTAITITLTLTFIFKYFLAVINYWIRKL